MLRPLTLCLLPALALAADTASVPELQEILSKPGAPGKLLAVRTLSETEGAEAAEALVQALSLERAVAFAAACALAEQGDARGVAQLREGLGFSQPLERVKAARALGQLRAAEAVGDLIALLEDENEEVRGAAIEALRDVTLQDFDYDPRTPAYVLPLSEEAKQETEAIAQWRTEQFEKLKEGKYVKEDGKEVAVQVTQRPDYEAKIKRAASDRWTAFRAKFEAAHLAARTASVAQWRAWWDGHREESPAAWLKAGLTHAKPGIRLRAAEKVGAGELRDFLKDLEQGLRKETDPSVVRAQARALVSFRDKASIETLVAFLERADASKEAVAMVDRALIDLTGVEGVAPSGPGWRTWWTRVKPFFEPRRVYMAGANQEYAVKVLKASSSGCTLEVHRWIPSESRWVSKPFEAKAGQAVGEKGVDLMDRHNLPVKIDLLPGLVVEKVERGTRDVRRRPLKRESFWRISLGVVDPWKPDDKARRQAEIELPAS